MPKPTTPDDFPPFMKLEDLKRLTPEELRRCFQEELRRHQERVEWAKELGIMDDEGCLVSEFEPSSED